MQKKHTKTQRRNIRRRAKRNQAAEEEEEEVQSIIGMKVMTKTGRIGRIITHDPNDELLELKVEFLDDALPSSDWFAETDLFGYSSDGNGSSPCNGCKGCSADSDDEGIDGYLMDFPEEDGAGDKHGLEEIPGGIAVDSGASDNVMARRHLADYKVQPSAGSRRKQKWGSASGHAIHNEGEVIYKCMVESGAVKRCKTQVGEVRRPLAAVSQMTKDQKNIVFFCEGEDWIVPRSDPLADEVIKLVRRIADKTKMHEHRGTYRMRAWMIPEKVSAKSLSTFGRQGI